MSGEVVEGLMVNSSANKKIEAKSRTAITEKQKTMLYKKKVQGLINKD
ncbi:hypothetical protein [Pedobacter sp.]